MYTNTLFNYFKKFQNNFQAIVTKSSFYETFIPTFLFQYDGNYWNEHFTSCLVQYITKKQRHASKRLLYRTLSFIPSISEYKAQWLILMCWQYVDTKISVYCWKHHFKFVRFKWKIETKLCFLGYRRQPYVHLFYVVSKETTWVKTMTQPNDVLWLMVFLFSPCFLFRVINDNTCLNLVYLILGTDTSFQN